MHAHTHTHTHTHSLSLIHTHSHTHTLTHNTDCGYNAHKQCKDDADSDCHPSRQLIKRGTLLTTHSPHHLHWVIRPVVCVRWTRVIGYCRVILLAVVLALSDMA